MRGRWAREVIQKDGTSAAIPAQYEPDFIAGLDGRTAVAKELRSRLAALENDLGGHDELSYQRRSLCRRAIALEAWVESLEARAARGEPAEIGTYTAAVNSLIALYRNIGLDRRARELSLSERLARSDQLGAKHQQSGE